MAIRIRIVDGKVIALCAVEADYKENDLYLDDAIHHALVTKFAVDYNIPEIADKELLYLMDKEKVRDAKTDIEMWLNK